MPLRSRFSKFSGQNPPADAAFVAGNAANRRSSLSRVARPLSKVRTEPAVESCGRFTFATRQIFGPISGPVLASGIHLSRFRANLGTRISLITLISLKTNIRTLTYEHRGSVLCGWDRN